MMPEGVVFHPIPDAQAIEEGKSILIVIDGWRILICRSAGHLYALENRCSHRDEPLLGGRVRRGQIFCPFHGARFALATGAVCSPPATANIRCFPVHAEAGAWMVGVPALPGD